ncbi:MAG: ABC transporter substrate-binding protein [Candidatus Rokubacteria bacterium]|nr:ABC transporter substrate-binding protein [Candidatus Rokubacteria bacterium]
MISRRALLAGTIVGMLVAPLAAAQPSAKLPRIGVLATTSWPPFEAFRHGLRDLGYVEGRTIAIEYRWSDGHDERFPELAAELVRLRVDAIVTWGSVAVRAARESSRTIPIVMAASGDAVATGAVTSYARPTGNVTGMSALNPDLDGKRLELLRQTVPRLRRVAFLGDPRNLLYPFALAATRTAAARLGLRLSTVEVAADGDLEGSFVAITKERADAIVVAPNAVFVLHRKELADLALKYRLPAIYLHGEHARAGGLMAYGPNYDDMFRRAATYVDKILKGAKPSDLPIGQPAKFDLVINLRTARALGLAIPPSVLLQADEVIQ